MKKLLSIMLTLSLILSVLAGCNGRNINNNSSGGASVDQSEYAPNMMTTADLNLWNPDENNEDSLHPFKGSFGDAYQDRVDNISFMNLLLGGAEWAKHKTYRALIINNSWSTDAFYVEQNLTRMPYLYVLIREFNISKSDFKKANQAQMSYYVDSQFYKAVLAIDRVYFFTDEEIELLYSDDTEAVREHFAAPWTIIHNGKIYPIGFFRIFDVSRWKEEGIPIEDIRERFKNVANPPYLGGASGSIFAAGIDNPLLDEKLAEYEKLLANG